MPNRTHTRTYPALAALFIAALLLVLADCRQKPQAADLILYNGIIWTVSDTHPTADAVAIKDGRFIAVGGNDEILAHKGRKTQVLDLDGHFALPGFNDNHVHFASAARFLEFNIMKTATQSEFEQKVQKLVAQLPSGEWILGGLWGAYDQWAAGSPGTTSRKSFTPDILLIDEITAEHPMFIRKFDDSEFSANSAALSALNLHPASSHEYADIRFELDAEGKFTGILRGAGVLPYVMPKLPARFSHERRLRQTKNALAEVRKYGVTNFSDMSDDEQLEIYRELRQRDELTSRVHFRYFLDRWPELKERGIAVGAGDEWIRLGSLKGHIDGIMGNSTARFFQPYTNAPDKRGRWRKLMVDDNGNFAEGKFLGHMLKADAAGLQLTVHAIGDEANSLLLDYLQELQQQNGKRDRRFRLVHAQVIARSDFSRLGELKVIAEVQPFHLSDDMRWMEERIGTERCKGAYAFKSILDSGGMLSFGTDWPGTAAAEYPINPMFGLYAAVTRKTVTGQPEAGWFPQERITIEEAVKAYTLNTAFANFEDDTKGSIEEGKLADIAVLSNNILEIPPEQLLNTRNLMTIVGGKVVFRSDEMLTRD